jgi:signal peptidase
MGSYQLLIVQSGSMEPTIPTGALVLIRSQAQYQVNDIVTFQTRGTGDGLPTTHRIIADGVTQGEVTYETKGDANADADVAPVRQRDVIGKVIYSVPYLGYLLDFARQPIGFALLIGVPAVVVAFEELSTILGMLRQRRKSEDTIV